IICLYDTVTIVAISKAEYAPFAVAALAGQLAGERAIKDIGFEFPPAVHLECAACRTSRQQREIQLRAVERVLDTIEAAANIGEAEVSDQPMRDPVALQGRQRGVLRRYLGPIDEFHSAHLERLARHPAQVFEPKEALLWKKHGSAGASPVGGEVGCTETQLAL